MWTVSICILCKVGEYICYSSRDIKFFLAIFWYALYVHMCITKKIINSLRWNMQVYRIFM